MGTKDDDSYTEEKQPPAPPGDEIGMFIAIRHVDRDGKKKTSYHLAESPFKGAAGLYGPTYGIIELNRALKGWGYAFDSGFLPSLQASLGLLVWV